MQQMQQMQQKSQGTGGGGGGNSAGSKVESRPSAPEPDDDDAIDPDVQELCAPWSWTAVSFNFFWFEKDGWHEFHSGMILKLTQIN